MSKLATANHNHAPFRPIQIALVDIDQPLCIPREYGTQNARVLLIIRLHGAPIGMIQIEYQNQLGEQALADAVWAELSEDINAHLIADSLPPIHELTTQGILTEGKVPCAQHRDDILRDGPFASVIVCTRDRTDLLERSLQHLLDLQYPRYEIIVVDNAPQTNATQELVSRLSQGSPLLRYVQEPIPGLSNARNAGLTAAGGEIIAYTDDDALTDPYWLAELAHGFQAGEKVACVTGLIFPAVLDTKSQLLFEQGGGFNKGYVEKLFDLSENRPPDRLFPYSAGTYGSGVNMAFKTSILQEIGGFDPALGAGTPAMGGEDLAAFVNLIVNGYQIAYQPRAFVSHIHRAEYTDLQRQMYAYGVGLTALFTMWAWTDPLWLLRVARQIPSAIWHILEPSSSKNRNKQADYPAELIRLERRGMLDGPLAYFRSQARTRRASRKNT